ncbi:hypothetical protein PCASD_17485 [Puccinia coronata f. sp. avenae]|uniref:Uncharacterized protein n=1 Tax=Puccinia coronata f. sp. avenae TaxID=200324 RepID=A0A2N5TWA2_9BASI|nr:hypothetical protein PCASD_17485 [Puccinia coronata f. sp. avenae]
MKRDLRSLSTANNLEGFVVLVSRDPDSSTLVTGGSLLGEQFLNMMTVKDSNPWQNFFLFVSGQQAIKNITGVAPTAPVVRKKQEKEFDHPLERAYNQGSRKLNLDAVRKRLAKVLSDAAHGKGREGWPGASTEATLKELGIELKVKKNILNLRPDHLCGHLSDKTNIWLVRILAGLGERWIELIGPPAPEVEVGGYLSIGAVGAAASGEPNENNEHLDENFEIKTSGSGARNAGRNVVQVSQRSTRQTKTIKRRSQPQKRASWKNKGATQPVHLGKRKRRHLVITSDSESNGEESTDERANANDED